MIKEWNLLRTLAALSVVLLHSTTFAIWNLGYPGVENFQFYRLLLTFATPAFIILSIIILANRYNNSIPNNFFSKRFKFIILPFISFAIIDALVKKYLASSTDVLDRILYNLTGNFEGYFIIIIFQFYILHYLVIRYKISVEKLLPVSILIMIVHLWIVNHTSIIPTDNQKSLRLLVTGWLGYFTVGFLVGKHYENVKKFLKDYKWTMLIIFGFAFYFMFLSFSTGNVEPNSKRIDIFAFTIVTCMLILAWGQVFPNLKVVNLISNYSLGIYLLHWQVLSIISPYVANYFTSPSKMIIALFFATTVISMILVKLISLLPFGKYIIGNTKRNFSKKTSKEEEFKLSHKTA